MWYILRNNCNSKCDFSMYSYQRSITTEDFFYYIVLWYLPPLTTAVWDGKNDYGESEMLDHFGSSRLIDHFSSLNKLQFYFSSLNKLQFYCSSQTLHKLFMLYNLISTVFYYLNKASEEIWFPLVLKYPLTEDYGYLKCEVPEKPFQLQIRWSPSS